MIETVPKPRQLTAIRDGGKAWAFPIHEPYPLAERIRDQQNIREQDRSVELESPHGLKRHLGRQLWSKTELEKVTGAFTNRPVFGQVATRLAHKPYRRRILAFAAQYLKEPFIHAVPVPSEFFQVIRFKNLL
jgi:hypothetical protein